MKKNLKGFTLVEVIVAFALFTIMAMILVSAVSLSGKYIIENNAYNNAINDNFSTFAAKKSVAPSTDKELTSGTIDIVIDPDGHKIQLEVYQKDEQLFLDAQTKVDAGTESDLTDAEKEIYKNKDVPRFRYFKLP